MDIPYLLYGLLVIAEYALLWVLFIGPMPIAFLFFRNRIKKIPNKTFNEYYDKKRQEYPWLDEWLKVNSNEPENRALGATFWAGIISPVLFVIIRIIVNWILFDKILLGFASGNAAMYDVMWGFPRHLVNVISIFPALLIVAPFAAIIMSKMKINPADAGNPENHLTLECPFCHCPHSWEMTFKQNIVDDEVTTTTTTTTTTEGGGTDFISSALNPGSTKTRKSTSTHFEGRVIREFRCLNCEKTKRTVSEQSWGKMPDEEPQELVIPAWNTKKAESNTLFDRIYDRIIRRLKL